MPATTTAQIESPEAKLKRQQAERATRAVEQHDDFEFIRQAPDQWVCKNRRTGGEYKITRGRCDCPNAVFVAHPNEGNCKHEIGLALRCLLIGEQVAK